MVNRHHLALTHQFLDEIIRLDAHPLSQFANGNDIGDPDFPFNRLGLGNFGFLRRTIALFDLAVAFIAIRLINLTTILTAWPTIHIRTATIATFFLLLRTALFFRWWHFRLHHRYAGY